jgi:high-affinity Fe2+/Pb2+ permease
MLQAFIITLREGLEAFLIIYALALGATTRGTHYLEQYPGWGGWALFLACSGAVFMAGAQILDCLEFERQRSEAEALP